MIFKTLISLVLPALLVSAGALPNLSPMAASPAHVRSHHNKKAAVAAPMSKRYFGGARATWYDVQTGNQVGCGGYRGNGEFLVAMNQGLGRCGQWLTIEYNGRSVQAECADICPDEYCPWGALDMSPAVFDALASRDQGVIYVNWRWNDEGNVGGGGGDNGGGNNGGGDNGGGDNGGGNSNPSRWRCAKGKDNLV